MKDQEEPREAQHFGKVFHVAWELGLLQELSHKDLLVFLCQVKHTDFETGECSPTAGVILRETGILRKGKNPRQGGYTQVLRCQLRNVALGLYRRGGLKALRETNSRPDRTGKRKKVPVMVRRYYQMDEGGIVRHVEEMCAKGLLPARIAARLAAWKHRRELRREAKGMVSVSPTEVVSGVCPGERASDIPWDALIADIYARK